MNREDPSPEPEDAPRRAAADSKGYEVESLETGPSLRDYLAVLWRRKLYILLATVIAVGVALSYSFRQNAKYTTTAEVLVLPVNFSPTEPADQQAPANMVNEVEVVTSAAVTDLVARRLEAADLRMADVTVDTPVTSGLLTIEAVSTDPASARATADAFAESYLEFRRDVVLEDLRSISEPIQALLDEINTSLIQTQQSLAEAQSESARSALQIRLGSLFTQRSLLEQKLNELLLPENLRVGEVLQPAPLPVVPFSPDHTRTGSFALFVGLSLGVGIAFLRDRLDPRLRGRDELERLTGAPVLGEIPRGRHRTSRRGPHLTDLQDAEPPVAEAYRTLRTSLSARIPSQGMATLVITSPHRAEGKTAVTTNLAVSLARSGRRVVIISDDLAGPWLQPVFGSPDRRRLTDVLKGKGLIGDSLASTPIQGVWALQAGYASSDFEMLITTRGVKQVLSVLRDRADVLLIDAPPVLENADALALAASSDGVLLVADVSRTAALSVGETTRHLDHVAAHVVGAVLMNADRARDRSMGRRRRLPIDQRRQDASGPGRTAPPPDDLGFGRLERSDEREASREASSRG
jgi:polysaccharide biosynthesis transport protein